MWFNFLFCLNFFISQPRPVSLTDFNYACLSRDKKSTWETTSYQILAPMSVPKDFHFPRRLVSNSILRIISRLDVYWLICSYLLMNEANFGWFKVLIGYSKFNSQLFALCLVYIKFSSPWLGKVFHLFSGPNINFLRI